MAYKVSIFWQQNFTLAAGWTENYWNDGSSLVTVKAATLRLIDALKRVHGRQTYPKRARYSTVPGFRITDEDEFGATFNGLVTAADGSDYPTTAVLMAFRGANGAITRQWIKGIPDDVVIPPGNFRPQGQLLNNFTALATYLASGVDGWRMRVLNPMRPTFALQSATANGLLTFSGATVAADSIVRISRAKGMTDLNAVWKVISTAGNTVQLDTGATILGPGAYAGGGKMRENTYSLIPMLSLANRGVEFVRATEHKVGRPTALAGGRRRRR